MSPIEKFESHFGKPLAMILKENHFRDGVPMYRLCKEAGVVRQSILWTIRLRGLRTMSREEAERYIDRSGVNAPRYGKKDPASSKRMKLNNPMKRPDVATRRAETISKTYRKKQLPQEKKFAEIAKELGLCVSPQVPMGPYVIDFVSGSTCIEIDSTSKWDDVRKEAARRKDEWVKAQGLKVVRINKNWLSDSRLIREILLANNLIGHE